MSTELLVASGAVVGVLLALLARRSRSGGGAGSDETALGKRYLEAQIDEHIGALAAEYDRVTVAEGRDPERFRLEIESFIAQVLERSLEEPDAAELRDAIREVLVLEREYVYDRIFARLQAHRAAG